MLEVYVYTVNLVQVNSFQLYKIALISPLDEQYYRFYLFSFLSFSFNTTYASLASCLLWVTTMTHLSFSVGGLAQDVDDVGGGGFVQVASRLVRQDDRRM